MARQKAIEAPDTEKVWTEEELWEPVTVRLPPIQGVSKQEAQFVAVNGREWVVPRGKDFELPRCAALVIQQAEDEMLRAIEYQVNAPYKREK